MKHLLVYAIFIVAVVAIGSTIGIFNLPGEWYLMLTKPRFNPPAWVFGPVWTLLYIMIGLVGARTFLADRNSAAMKIWYGQMGLNFLWSPAFFGLESALTGLIVIVPMLLMILWFVATTWKSDRLAALLFLPYTLWVSFATLLNAALFALN